MSKIQSLSVISFLSFGVILGALVFSRGFLLTRKVIKEKSPGCWNSSAYESVSSLDSLASDSSSWCNPSPVFPKIIILLVDALRFDFVDRMTFLSKITESKEYGHQQQQQSSNGISSCRLKFIADPPTTTMQRLKALMTGTMPTFIDASANFNSYECEEDSLIYQFQLAKKKIAFLGDDTWLGLFPRNLFTSPYVEAHPSFNAWDLDTVDTAVSNSLHRILKEEDEKNWDVIIAHILGVDHCGHRYGPHHKEMERKLKDADHLIEFIFNAMSHDTLLVIFGDHGMTKTGDHGGDSADEVDSALIFLSKQLKRNKQINPPFQCQSTKSDMQSISQIDLVPTISSMMGIPIPYSNIGQIISNFLVPKVYSDAISSNVAQVQKYITKYAGNDAEKMHQNQNAAGDFVNSQPSQSTNNLNLYQQVEQAYMEYQTSRNTSTRAKLHLLAQNYLSQVKAKAVSTWTQFDIPTINIGLFITFLSLICLLIYVSYVPILSEMHNYTVLHWLWPSLSHWTVLCSVFYPSGIAGIVVSTISGLCVFFFTLLYKLIKRAIYPIISSTTSMSSNSFSTTNSVNSTSSINNGKNSNNVVSKKKKAQQQLISKFISSMEFKNKWIEFGSIIIYTVSCLGVFSNSFVINEGYILSCLLITVVLIHQIFSKDIIKNLLRTNRSVLKDIEPFSTFGSSSNNVFEDNLKKSPEVNKFYKCSWSCFFLLAIFLRISHIFFRCREELTECTEVYLLHKNLNTLPSDWNVHKYVRYSFALFSLAVFVVLFRHWTILRKSTASSRITPLVANYVPTTLVVLIGVFWALQGLPFVDDCPTDIRPFLHHFPLVYQTITIISLLIIWFKPICCIGNIRSFNNKKRSSSRSSSKDEDKIKKEIANHSSTVTVTPNNLNLKKNTDNKSCQNGQVPKFKGSNGIVIPDSLKENPEIMLHFGNKEINLNSTTVNNDVSVDVDLIKIASLDSLSEDIFSTTILTLGALVTLLLVQISSDGISSSITLSVYSAIALVGIFRLSSSQNIYSWTSIISWTLASQYFFYATGHQPIFSAIPWDSAFVGEGNDLGSTSESWIPWIRPAFAVLGNLHVSQIIFATFLPLLTYMKKDNKKPESLMGKGELRMVYTLGGKYLALHGFKLSCCMLCAFWQRRHLMVWKIFAPRFIFEMISYIITIVSITFSLLFVTRIDFLFQRIITKEKMEKSNDPSPTCTTNTVNSK